MTFVFTIQSSVIMWKHLENEEFREVWIRTYIKYFYLAVATWHTSMTHLIPKIKKIKHPRHPLLSPQPPIFVRTLLRFNGFAYSWWHSFTGNHIQRLGWHRKIIFQSFLGRAATFHQMVTPQKSNMSIPTRTPCLNGPVTFSNPSCWGPPGISFRGCTTT